MSTPHAGVLVRPARASDLPELWRVRYAVTENTLTPGRISDATLRASLEETGRGWVAEVDGVVQGFAIALHDSGQVWALFVAPEAQGCGLGSRLHDTMLQWMHEQGHTRLWLTTGAHTRARDFYAHRGWKAIGAHGEDEVIMERLLA
jgi:GNAT superfamily N-acetyltransferase